MKPRIVPDSTRMELAVTATLVVLCTACAKPRPSQNAGAAAPTKSTTEVAGTTAAEPAKSTGLAESGLAESGLAESGSASVDPDVTDGTQPEADSAEPAVPQPREVRYILGGGGALRIEVDGVRITPSATPEKNKWGWGVVVTIQVQAIDDAEHSLLNPERGPLAFAGRVLHKGGKVVEFSDDREGGQEAVVTSEPSEFRRTWPSKNTPPLGYGQTLELEVGLWGLGKSAENRRPVRKLFRLKMAAANRKPQPVIMPPESAEQ